MTNPSFPSSKFTAKERSGLVITRLEQTYPNAHCELNYTSPLELLIATILSAQCTDVRVNLVTPALFKRFPNASTYASAKVKEIEELVHSTGFYHNKAQNIKKCCQQLCELYQGEVPQTLAQLHALAGVGRKTANVVLGNVFGINEGVVVDTHVSRLSQRLGLTRKKDPIQIERLLMRLIPREKWTLFPHLLIWHGRKRCKARNPDCAQCELLTLCPRIGIS